MRHSFVFLALVGLVAPAAAAERKLVEYLPDDTQFVASVNVGRILGAPLSKRYLEQGIQKNIVNNDGIQKLSTLLDFDPLRDLDRVSIAVPEGGTQGKATIFVEGSFDPDKIHKVVMNFNDSGNVKILKGTVPIYEAKNEKGQTFFTAVLDTKMLVVTTEFNYMDEVLAKEAGRRKSKVSAQLNALIAKQDPKQAAWVVGVVTEDVKQLLAKNPQAGKFATKLNAVVAGVKIDEDIDISARVETTDAETAQQLTALANAGKTIATFAINGEEKLKHVRPMLLQILGSIKINQAKNVVGLDMTVTGKSIDKLVQEGFGK